MHVSGKGAIENRNEMQQNNFESGMDGPSDTFEVDNSHLSLTDERVGKTACGFLSVRGATLDPRHHPWRAAMPRGVVTKLWPKPVESSFAFWCSSLFFFLMRKCCPALIRLQSRPPLFTSFHSLPVLIKSKSWTWLPPPYP